MLTKPGDPQIYFTCDDCEGTGIQIESVDRDDGRGHYTVDTTHACGTCHGYCNPPMKFDRETCTLSLNDDLSSEWGAEDQPETINGMLAACDTEDDGVRLQAWFDANAAHCAELAADARSELCGQAADEAERILSQLHKLFADLVHTKIPCRQLSIGVAAITLAIPDIRSDGRARTATDAARIFTSLDAVA